MYWCASSARTTIAAAAPSATPAQSNTPRSPATFGDVADRLDRHLAPELRTRVAGAVVVVLPRDVRHRLAQLVGVDAVLVGVRGRDHREHRRRGERAAGAVVRRRDRVEALVAAVLHLLDADRHRDVVGTRRHRVRGLAQRLGAGGAEVLDPGDRLVLELQRAGERDAAHAALRGAEPVGVDVVLVDAGRRVRLVGGVDEQVVEALVPVLDEGRAPHPDDRDPVLDPVASHRAPAFPSRSSCRCRRRCTSRRNVISTRLPICDLVGVDVGELDRQPPAAVEVDDREHDRRARRVGQAVDGEGDDRALHVGQRHGVHLVGVLAVARHARRRQVHHAGVALLRADEAELPVLAARGGRRRHARRLGPARRLDREHAPPREELAVRAAAPPAATCAAIGRARPVRRRARRWRGTGARRRRRRARTSATTCPGSACSSSAASSSPGCAAPALPTVGARSSITCTPSSFPPTARADPLRRRGDGGERRRRRRRARPPRARRSTPARRAGRR